MTKQQIIESIPNLSHEDLADLSSIFSSICRGEDLHVSSDLMSIILARAKAAKQNEFRGSSSEEVFRKLEEKYGL